MSKIKKSGARKWILGLLAGVSSIAVFASCAPAFAAADAETKAEIRALKEQLKRLEKRLESQAQSQRQTERKVERVEATVEAPPPPGSPVRVVSKDGAPWPTAFYYKAVTVTPGGFFEFGALHRDHYIGADIATPFGQIPFPNNPTSHEDETRFTARRSRFILQTDANLDENTHVKEYLAADFLSAAQTANSDAERFVQFPLPRTLCPGRQKRLRRPYHGGSGLFAHRLELARHHGGHIYYASGHRRPVHAWLYLVSSAGYSIEQGYRPGLPGGDLGRSRLYELRRACRGF